MTTRKLYKLQNQIQKRKLQILKNFLNNHYAHNRIIIE